MTATPPLTPLKSGKAKAHSPHGAISYEFSTAEYDYSQVYQAPVGYAIFLEAYQKKLARLTVGYESQYLPTRFGPTHVLVAGRDATEAPPVLLLHGHGDDAMSLSRYLEYLAGFFRVYAVDVNGQSCKSAPVRLDSSNLDYAAWLLDVLEGLGLSRCHCLGEGSGGAMFLKLGQVAPYRIASLAMINPTGIIPPNFSGDLGLMTSIWALRYLRSRWAVRKFIGYHYSPAYKSSLFEVEALVERTYNAIKYLLPSPPFPLFEDSDLKYFKAPALLILGDQNRFLKPPILVERARQLIPHLAIEMIRGAAHCLPEEAGNSSFVALVRFIQWANAYV